MRKMTHSDMVSELNNGFWFNWDGQKQKTFEVARELMVHYEYEPSDAISKAYELVTTFHKEVMDKQTRIYFN